MQTGRSLQNHHMGIESNTSQWTYEEVLHCRNHKKLGQESKIHTHTQHGRKQERNLK